MTPKLRTLLPLLLLALLYLSTISEAKEDPQLRECQRACSQKPRQQREHCEQRCWEKYQEKGRERERERERELVDNPKGDAEKRYGQCRRRCEETQKYGEQQYKQCEQRCQQRYQQEKERSREQESERGQDKEIDPRERVHRCKEKCREEHDETKARDECVEWCEEIGVNRRERGERDINPRREEEEEESEQRGGKNPYVFKREHFKQRLRTEHGNIRVLKNFLKQSKLLLGIANYRIAVVELNPRTFLLPNHWDADDICYVIKGTKLCSSWIDVTYHLDCKCCV